MLHTFKEFLSRVQIHNASLYANNVSKQLIFPFFLPLQKTAMPLCLSVRPEGKTHWTMFTLTLNMLTEPYHYLT